MEKEQKNEEQKNEWIRAKEQLPKNNEIVLVQIKTNILAVSAISKKKVNKMIKITVNGEEIQPEEIKLTEKQIKLIINCLSD